MPTTSSSSGAYEACISELELPWPSSPVLFSTVVTIAWPAVTASVIKLNTSGLTCAHGVALSFVTVM